MLSRVHEIIFFLAMSLRGLRRQLSHCTAIRSRSDRSGGDRKYPVWDAVLCDPDLEQSTSADRQSTLQLHNSISQLLSIHPERCTICCVELPEKFPSHLLNYLLQRVPKRLHVVNAFYSCRADFSTRARAYTRVTT